MVGWLVAAGAVLLLGLQTWWYVERCWDLKQQHSRAEDRLRQEYQMQDKMLKTLTLPDVMP